ALGALSREQKRRLVSDLYHQGAFKAKSAADYIANVLSMGRATVYKHLRELKQE
ncbi:MAG: helix-turn-helix domain-containing protein, partial [Serratia marcescens]|nr:helix-turn-helix domain-containing protein [Serratia marcescens]